MDLGLANVPVLVTGGSRGIGRGIARAFAREGARVAVCGRDAAALADTAAELRALGVLCEAIGADLGSEEGCTRAVVEAARVLGGLQVLVNNASANVDAVPRSLQDASDEQVLARINGKLLAAVRCARAALPYLRRGGAGRIVNIGGTSARSVFRDGEVPGNGSGLPQGLGNAALANFSKHLAEEVAADGILVNVVHPHITRTERHAVRVERRSVDLGVPLAAAEVAIARAIPLGRVIDVDDIAALVVFLGSARAAAITGQAIAVDGGASRTIVY